jgi:hypothetical protein
VFTKYHRHYGNIAGRILGARQIGIGGKPCGRGEFEKGALYPEEIAGENGAYLVSGGEGKAELRFGGAREAFDLVPIEQRQVLFLVSVESYTRAILKRDCRLLNVPLGSSRQSTFPPPDDVDRLHIGSTLKV